MPKPEKRIRAVLFDIDGTLVDSNDLHAEAWVEAFRHFGREVPYETVRGQIGKGGDNLIPDTLPDVGPDEQEEMEKFRGELFKEKYLAHATPFPGVCELFEKLRDDDVRIVLASSAKQGEMEHHKERIGCGDLVDGATTADDVEHSKPDPDIFAAALKTAGVRQDEAVIVGDSPFDVEAGRRLGVPVVAVRAGKFPDEVLREAGALAIYDGVEELARRYEETPLAA